MKNPYNKILGAQGEALSAEYYKKRGFIILEKNFFNRRGKQLGEIDLIAIKNKNLHFIEVKTRTSRRFGSALEAVGRGKVLHIISAAKFFLSKYKQFQDYNIHFDVAVVHLPNSQFDKVSESVTIYSDVIDET